MGPDKSITTGKFNKHTHLNIISEQVTRFADANLFKLNKYNISCYISIIIAYQVVLVLR